MMKSAMPEFRDVNCQAGFTNSAMPEFYDAKSAFKASMHFAHPDLDSLWRSNTSLVPMHADFTSAVQNQHDINNQLCFGLLTTLIY